MLENWRKNDCKNLFLHPKPVRLSSIKFIPDVNFQSWLDKFVNLYFSKYQSYKYNYKFTCCFENHWKMAAIVSIFNLIPMIWVTNHFLIWYIIWFSCHDHVNLSALAFGNINLTKAVPNLLFGGKFNLKVTAVISICTLNFLKLL